MPWRSEPNRWEFTPRTPVKLDRKRDAVWRYGIAVCAVAAALGLRLIVHSLFGPDLPFLMQFVAVIAAAAVGGLGPGLVATLLGAAVTQVLSADPADALHSPELHRFLIEAALICILGSMLRNARLRAEAADIASAALEKQMVEIGDQERRRFGHDLHDGLGQQLTGIALLSESLSHRLSAQSAGTNTGATGGSAAELAETITSLVSETIGWTRDIARGLSPLTLEIEGLPTALEDLAESAGKLFRIRCTIENIEQSFPPISDAAAVHVYRIIQEALSNSVKHGKAKNVLIRIAVEGGRSLVFTVEDDGSGLSAKTIAEPGIGLRIMQYRANLIGARLSVARRSAAGGTSVSCIVPIQSATSEAGDVTQPTRSAAVSFEKSPTSDSPK